MSTDGPDWGELFGANGPPMAPNHESLIYKIGYMFAFLVVSMILLFILGLLGLGGLWLLREVWEALY